MPLIRPNINPQKSATFFSLTVAPSAISDGTSCAAWSPSFKIIFPALRLAIGVAPAMASAFAAVVHLPKAPKGPIAGRDQVAVRAMGKQMYIKHLPASAGLKILRPNPPNISLVNITAKTTPIVKTCNGTVGGIISTNIVVVTNKASDTDSPRLRVNKNSTMKPTTPAQAIKKRQRQPK